MALPCPVARKTFSGEKLRLVGAVMEKPVGDDLQRIRREGFFDGGVFDGRAGIGVLEEVVQVGKFADVDVLIAGILKSLLEHGEIRFGGDLQILLTVEREDGNLQCFQIGKRVIIQKKRNQGDSIMRICVSRSVGGMAALRPVSFTKALSFSRSAAGSFSVRTRS